MTIPFGKYDLLERINIGGMAEVLKARDLGQPGAPIVAVKRILPHLIDDRQYVTMFLDESRVLAQLEHDNVIRTLAVGQVDHTPFIALEYVFGPDARMMFHKSRRTEQPIPTSIACYVMAQVCAALHYAHEREDADGNLLGLVHRDVSLQNVLLSYEGAVKLTDFGIAMSVKNIARTEAGVVKGKFGYMAPEQVKGEPMDRRSDVFSSGICLYELLTGERLFSGDNDYQAVERVRNVRIDPPSRYNRMIPSSLEAIVMKALAKAPRDRYQTAGELRRALLEFMAESGNECSPRQLGQYLRTLFADEIERRPTPETLHTDGKRLPKDTGLAAFDNLDPVSGVSEPRSIEALAPSNVAPGTVQTWDALVEPQGQPSDAWPEPAFAANAAELGATPHYSEAGAEHDPIAGLPREEDRTQVMHRDEIDGLDDAVTRQIVINQPIGWIQPAAPPRSEPPPAGAALPKRDSSRPPTSTAPRELSGFERAASTPYGVVLGIVATIVAAIALSLQFTRNARPAALHFATMPTTPVVKVDGERIKNHESPFVIDRLEPKREHLIEVSMDGYQTWSTRLTLESGQTLKLPSVTLVPSAAVEPAGSKAPSATPPAAAHAGSRDTSPKARPPRGAPVRAAARKNGSGEDKAPAPKAGKDAPRPAAATAGMGILRLNSRPWSVVTIDGKRIGNTPIIDLRLPAGTHDVELHNPDLKLRKKLKVKLVANKTVTRAVDLK